VGFRVPEDIANRALQHVGAPLITSLTAQDRGAIQINQCYTGLRKAELRRNVWTFACRKAVLYPINTGVTSLPIGSATDTPNPGTLTGYLPTLQLIPETWSAGKAYEAGSIVQLDGVWWVSSTTLDVGMQPGLDASTGWDVYFGSDCVQPYDPTKTYYVGDLVYQNNAGVLTVFVSLENGNANNPTTPTPWTAGIVYSPGEVVQDAAGFFWQSQTQFNLNQQPGIYGHWSGTPTYVLGALVIGSDQILYSSLIASNHNVNPANGANPASWAKQGAPGSWPMWNPTTTYGLNGTAVGSDGIVYQSLQAGNTGNQPVGSTYNPLTPTTNWWMSLGYEAPWASNFNSSTANASWLGLSATLGNLNITYPIGTGPTIQTTSKNIFKLPKGYLRTAPQDPKRGSVSPLGAPTGMMYNDWEYDGQFIISQTPFPIVFRFVADVTQVGTMDDMFCEALGARIGMEVCEAVTQSNSKIATAAGMYKQFVNEARTVNGIEQGPTEPPLDDYISCRL
jgi:hypothetical protein